MWNMISIHSNPHIYFKILNTTETPYMLAERVTLDAIANLCKVSRYLAVLATRVWLAHSLTTSEAAHLAPRFNAFLIRCSDSTEENHHNYE